MIEIRRQSSEAEPLYRRILQSEWDALPGALKVLHDVRSRHEFVGRARVRGAETILAQIIARIIGFPTPSDDIPVQVRLETHGVHETWTRTFGEQTFCSTQELGTGRYAGLLVERFGGFAFGLKVEVAHGTLKLLMKRWSFLGVPLPRALAPTSQAQESEQDGQFRFDVAIVVPLAGRLVHYTGTLVPKRDHPTEGN